MSDALELAEAFQNQLISIATGGVSQPKVFREERTALIELTDGAALVPRFVKTCRSPDEFWQFIKHKFPTYKERRDFIWNEMRPLLDYLESGGRAPADHIVSAALEKFDAEHIKETWSKALERREVDSEGAITSARTLLESVCKHVLDEMFVDYGENPDIKKLYSLAAKALSLSPSQHTEDVFKQILGGCTAVVEGLGAVRNRLSDSHGKGRAAAKPAPRHAELAVNLAGTMALFILATFEQRFAGEDSA